MPPIKTIPEGLYEKPFCYTEKPQDKTRSRRPRLRRPAARARLFHKYDVVGFDVNQEKVDLMKNGIDPTGEVPEGGLKDCKIEFTTDAAKLAT